MRGPKGPTRRAGPTTMSWRWLPQPEARVRRLHRVADSNEQLAPKGVEVDLVAQAERERVERACGVVAGPVEAAVYAALDAGAYRIEKRHRGQRRQRDRELVPLGERAQHPLQADDRGDVERAKGHDRRAVHERAVDEDVDVVQAVTEDGDACAERDGRDAAGVPDYGDHIEPCRLAREPIPSAEEPESGDAREREGGRVDEPLELLALDPAGSPPAEEQRKCHRERQGGPNPWEEDSEQRVEAGPQRPSDADRIGDSVERRPCSERAEREDRRGVRPEQEEEWSPASRWHAAGRKKQQGKERQGERKVGGESRQDDRFHSARPLAWVRHERPPRVRACEAPRLFA